MNDTRDLPPVESLLDPDEPAAVNVLREDAPSAFFLTCEHAGRRIPRRLGDLGLEEGERTRHIAWDIGAEGVATGLSERLQATLVTQIYSRLVVDCNRPLGAQDLVAPVSEDTRIPGNQSLGAGHVAARVEAVHRPYHQAIAARLDARGAAGRATVLVAVHSFTPVYRGVERPWHVGLLYNRDDRLATVLDGLLAGDRTLCVGHNEPYRLSDRSDYTVPVHGERRGIPSLEIEIRQDLIAEPAAQDEWAERLAELFTRALQRLRERHELPV